MPGFGRLEAVDPRDENHLMQMVLSTAPAPAAIVDKITYRTGTYVDQGETGTCVGQGWRNLLSAEPIRTTKGPSAFDIYDAAIAIDEWKQNDADVKRQYGTSVRAGAKVLQEWGFLERYVWAKSAGDIMEWMLAGLGGVVIGTNWYDGMMTPDADGVIHITGRSRGGHCTYVYGADRPGGMFLIQNSWGPGWGGWRNPVGGQRSNLGKCRISVMDMDRLIRENGEACTPVEKKNTLWTGVKSAVATVVEQLTPS